MKVIKLSFNRDIHVSSSKAAGQLILCCNITKPIRIPHRNCSPWRAFRENLPRLLLLAEHLTSWYSLKSAMQLWFQLFFSPHSPSLPNLKGRGLCSFLLLPQRMMETLSGEVIGMRLNQSSVASVIIAEMLSSLTVPMVANNVSPVRVQRENVMLMVSLAYSWAVWYHVVLFLFYLF